MNNALAAEFFAEIAGEIAGEIDASIMLKVGDSEIEVRDGYVKITKPCATKKFEFVDRNFVSNAVEFIKSKIDYLDICYNGEYCRSITDADFKEIMRSDKSDEDKHEMILIRSQYYQTFNTVDADFWIDSYFDKFVWNDVVELWEDMDAQA